MERAVEIERVAWVFAENGLWKRARTYQIDVLKFRTKKLGRFHADTIQAQRSLAQSNFNLFDIIPCISVQRHILDTHWYARPAFADWMTSPPWKPEHVPYCITLSDLAISLWFTRKLDWSKRAGERAVKGLMKRLSPDDPPDPDRHVQPGPHIPPPLQPARQPRLARRSPSETQATLRPDHPDTLMVRSELSMSFRVARERLPAAERLVSNVLAAQKKLLGEEHTYTLWSMNDLARVLTARQRPHEAIAILKKVAPILRRTLGDPHPGMSMTKANLTQEYVRAERWGRGGDTAQGVAASCLKGPSGLDRCHVRAYIRADGNGTYGGGGLGLGLPEGLGRHCEGEDATEANGAR